MSAVFNEPASFNEPKPVGLDVSDDTWAALKLRVDPLARHILDPHRSYVGAAALGSLVALVFLVVRPGWHIVDLSSYYDKQNEANGNHNYYYYDYAAEGGGDEYDNWNNNNGASGDAQDDDALDAFYDRSRDDDYYNNDGIDDIVLAELEYRNEELVHASIAWRIGFIAALSILFVATVTVAVGMELKNARYDAKIHDVIAEMRERFEMEGYEIGYRTRTEISGVLFGHLRPQRAIYFKRVDDDDGSVGGPSIYRPPIATDASRDPVQSSRSASGIGTNLSFGGIGRVGSGGSRSTVVPNDVLVVEVPEGKRPGQMLTIMTPAGDQIMVAIPPHTMPGQSFPVLLPPKPKPLSPGGAPSFTLSNVSGLGTADYGAASSPGTRDRSLQPKSLRSRRSEPPREFEMTGGKIV
eukprot:CAMPEP_0181056666 /NCGR_PEP_ID=MMETSP1070-20121207/19840_1 /TAXON_ID=265543 /ORGANISM="Minutocellus polymorphus, Strain NH13" /LENGTH=409 /DNA_ID=CAMNT_0023136031 /DNA_START=233 /DNA_END=1462 /DNA_ORIENTATION=+